jgi:hypothetical protein
MVRAALSDYMQRHPATAIQDRSNPPDVSSETRPESKKKRSNRIEWESSVIAQSRDLLTEDGI